MGLFGSSTLNLGRQIRTRRLILRPVSWHDLQDVIRLKTNGASFGLMLGGVRSRKQVEDEMAEDLAFWARRRIGIFTIQEDGRFVGITGLHERPDGRGLGLRFALVPEAAGRGVAREAAGAALRYALDAGVNRVIGVTRQDNIASRIVLGSIGMQHLESFEREGYLMLVYEIRQASQSKV